MKVITISAKAQHGKDTTAEFFKEIAENNGEKVLIVHYADYLKYLCKEWFGWDGVKDEKGRSILQKVGTDLARNNHPDIWVNVIVESLKAFGQEYDYVLIPDCRFPNEIAVMKNNFDTTSLRVTRMGFKSNLTNEQKNHISEIALDDYCFDYRINTVSGLDALRNRVKGFYNYLLEVSK